MYLISIRFDNMIDIYSIIMIGRQDGILQYQN